MNDYYIYYQVQAANAAALRAQVEAMQAHLRAHYGVKPQLKCRHPGLNLDTHDSSTEAAPALALLTWMEVYPSLPQGFEVTLEYLAREAGVPDLCASARHMEIFMDLTPCA